MLERLPQTPLNPNGAKELGQSPERTLTLGIFDMGPEQEERFRARVERRQGFVILFVHPNYHEYVERTGRLVMQEERGEIGRGRIKKNRYNNQKTCWTPF